MKLLACLFTLCLTVTANAGVMPLTNQKEVEAAFAKHRPMVIMFHAEWCGPCKYTVPEYIKAEKELGDKVDFYIIDTDKFSFKIAKPIDAIPAFVAGNTEKQIRSAKSLDVGGRNAAEIIKYIKKHVKF